MIGAATMKDMCVTFTMLSLFLRVAPSGIQERMEQEEEGDWVIGLGY